MIIDIKTAAGESRRIVTDPGFYSIEEHDKIQHADIVLITHEHADHLHVESLKAMVKRIPRLSVIANDAVGEILAKEGIEHRIMEHGDKIDLKDVHIEAYGKHHAIMHKSIPPASNVGFFIENKLFFPGDAFTDPKKPVDVLALPVAGPWMKVSEALDYAIKLKPRVAFPVHDGLAGAGGGFLNAFYEKILGPNGIEFVKLEEGGELEVK